MKASHCKKTKIQTKIVLEYQILNVEKGKYTCKTDGNKQKPSSPKLELEVINMNSTVLQSK